MKVWKLFIKKKNEGFKVNIKVKSKRTCCL